MALTVGTKRYDGSKGRGLANLLERNDVQEALRKYFVPDARANALRKLQRWIDHSAESWIPQWRKGQNKSFATASEMVLWLQYKSERVFQPSATREKELAELINDCPGIRRTVAQLITIHLDREFDLEPKAVKDRVSAVTGRYASFYSKVFFKRNLGEGLSYFKKQRNPSLSEMAAFLCDFGLEARPFTKPCTIMPKGHDNLRTNQAMVDDAVAKAMAQLDRSDSHQARQAAHQALVAEVAAPGARFEELEKTARDQYNRELEIFQKALSPDDIRKDPQAWQRFQDFKKLPGVNLDDDAVAFSSPKWQTYKQNIKNNLTEAAKDKAKRLLDNQIKNSKDAIDDKVAKTTAAAKGSVKRGNYNVAVDHQWTRLMMEKSAVIGAGPSSTTAVTLGLVDHCILGVVDDDRIADKTRLAVAASLFAFWQRKKNLLRGFSAVHTWNEVMTALDNYLWTGSDFAPVLDSGASEEMQFKMFEYPDSFAEDGRPVFLSNSEI